jgi:hypothetical protein
MYCSRCYELLIKIIFNKNYYGLSHTEILNKIFWDGGIEI